MLSTHQLRFCGRPGGGRAQRVTTQHIEAADLIVAMDLSHLELMAREFPSALSKTTLLGLFAPDGRAEISDPYDFGPAATREVLEQIVRAVHGLAGLQPASQASSTRHPNPVEPADSRADKREEPAPSVPR